jgi:Leucine Rich Repeat (LRR) protein
MSHDDVPRRTLESLKKEAKRWLAAIRDGDVDARRRLERALPGATRSPGLRDVQLALAREHGFNGWPDFKAALERAGAARTSTGAVALAKYQRMADALLEAYRTGTPEAMERHYRYTWHRRAWSGMRRYVQLDLGKLPDAADDAVDVDITPADARHLVAREYGFDDWPALVAFTETLGTVPKKQSSGLAPVSPLAPPAAKPVRLIDPSAPEISQTILRTRDWNAILDRLAAQPEARFCGEGQITDAILAAVARLEGITDLDLSGSQELTDDGLQQLARLPQLKRLDLSRTAITDRGVAVLRELPVLESISLSMTHVTDEGAQVLAGCEALRRVDLAWTHTGDGVVRALAGKPNVSQLFTGNSVTDAGLAVLAELPVFRTWQGGPSVPMRLFTGSGEPNGLWLRGSFTDRGMEQLRRLEGLYDLNIDDPRLAITADAMKPLVSLPHLERLSVDAKDDWMPHIAAMPRLRFLLVQDTTATDDGFVALGRSSSIELIWGRRCLNLRNRGFLALAQMPALRSLSVSCLNVDDSAVATLPLFPSLRELMPMDVPDAGYRHIGKCEQLESLVLMYCRDTSDETTGHIAGLQHLTEYFNSYTRITDRTPELLSTMDSLIRVTLDTCHELTNEGIAKLARLPHLRELRVAGKKLTSEVARAFRPDVVVSVGQ